MQAGEKKKTGIDGRKYSREEVGPLKLADTTAIGGVRTSHFLEETDE